MKAQPLNPDLPVCTLGEGPIWDAASQRLCWVDIKGCMIHGCDADGRAPESFPTGDLVGFAIPLPDGRFFAGVRNRLVIAGGSGLEAVEAFDFPDDIRFNDGKCDPSGALWAGTIVMSDDEKDVRGVLYHKRGRVSEIADRGFHNSNGKDWSADGNILYHADTAAKKIWRYYYDAGTGAVGNRSEFLKLDSSPDGLSTDLDGNLYIALYGAGEVAIHDASGKRTGTISVAAPNVTSCAFGGPDLNRLYITTARDGMDEDALARTPLAGQVFFIDLDATGRAAHLPSFL